MCGLAGAVSFSKPLAVDRLKPMVDAIRHRGPDDSGFLVWQTGRSHPHGMSFGAAFNERRFQHISPLLPSIDTSAGQERLGDDAWDVFLGHRRLAIIDLTPRGHQPMTTKDQSHWLVFNGEIYNYRELRRELQSLGYSFSSDSDTEVLLNAHHAWGEKAVERFNGMFAYALWDTRRRQLWLARDRYGIKPLYWRCRPMNSSCSVRKSSRCSRTCPMRPRLTSRRSTATSPSRTHWTIGRSSAAFACNRQARSCCVDLESRSVTTRVYWDFDFSQETTLSEPDIVDNLYHLINQAVRRQCVSDVPIGSYLSGGLDSGTVTAVTSEVFGRIFTFTTGFDLSEAAQHEISFDEREQAEHMANLLKTEHYECVLHAGDMEAVLDKLVWHLEDLRVGQCYPNYYTARLVSKFVKVVMSGVGGDELFGGYPWRYAAALSNPQGDWAASYYRYWQRLIGDEDKKRFFHPDIARQFRRDYGGSFGEHSLDQFRQVFRPEMNGQSRSQQVNQSLYFECKSFLHGLLVVEDKLSMAFGLETRVPFLDNDLVDFACRVPIRYKVSGMDEMERIDENMPRKKEYVNQVMNTGKTILRKAMGRVLGPNVTRARKQGFSAPDESWFRGSSANYIRSMLLSSDSKTRDYLDQEFVRTTLEQHVAGAVNKRLLIWSILCFEWWLRNYDSSAGVRSLVRAA